MPLVPVKCTSCGGVLKVDQTSETAICSYCKTPFVIEKAINNYHVTNKITAGTVNISGFDEKAALTHARNLCKNKEFKQARNLLVKTIETCPTSGEAYLLMVMVDYGIDTQENLARHAVPLNKSKSFKYAMQYLDENGRKALENAEKTIRSRIEKEISALNAQHQNTWAPNTPQGARLLWLKAKRNKIAAAKEAEFKKIRSLGMATGFGLRVRLATTAVLFVVIFLLSALFSDAITLEILFLMIFVSVFLAVFLGIPAVLPVNEAIKNNLLSKVKRADDQTHQIAMEQHSLFNKKTQLEARIKALRKLIST